MSKKLEFLKAVFNWGKKKALLPDLTGPLSMDADSESYEAFTQDDLKRLFEGEAFVANRLGRPSQFWLPLLGLYTGGRIDELASIELAHVQVDNGINGILLSPGGETTGKNKFSRRFVPLHPALERCGFMEYVGTLRKEGHTELFPCLPEAKRDGKGKAASRDFQKFRQSVGVGAAVGEGRGTKVFHSFRATLTTAMQSAGVPEEVRMAITGHARNKTAA